jgi:hypothetical protein
MYHRATRVGYTFWDERLPEALALIGKPLVVEDGGHAPTEHWHASLTQAMTEADAARRLKTTTS